MAPNPGVAKRKLCCAEAIPSSHKLTHNFISSALHSRLDLRLRELEDSYSLWQLQFLKNFACTYRLVMCERLDENKFGNQLLIRLAKLKSLTFFLRDRSVV